MSSGRRPGRRRWHGRVRPAAPGPEVPAGGTRPNPDTVAYPGVTRSTAVMATGTTLSRVTGVIRQMALAYAVGAFALVRHPVYAAWIVFLLPGLGLLSRSWLLLVTPLVAYAVFKTLIAKEDDYLTERFGQPYLDYRARVREIIPLPRF